eukprot:507188-Amphidinium_carterae.1
MTQRLPPTLWSSIARNSIGTALLESNPSLLGRPKKTSIPSDRPPHTRNHFNQAYPPLEQQ